jgi:Ca2+-binding RTX toxin-like protein
MTLATESVTLAGSGLVFINYYGSGVTDAYRSAVITAENYFQSHFTNPVTVGMDFEFTPLGQNFSAQNSFSAISVSYSQFTSALAAHETTVNDQLAVAGLPASDPSQGAGFSISGAEARILGLAAQSNSVDDTVTLNSSLPFTFGQDAVGAIEHEMSEGVFGRSGSLGFQGSRWAPMDLYRFTAAGQRDYSGGQDGVTTYFGIDGAHVTSLQYHASISSSGANDGYDLADWEGTRGDSFGPGGPGSPGTISATDLQVLDVLGWSPTGSAPPYTPAPDEFASSLTDSAHPFGVLTAGGSASGALQTAGDRDLFRVTLQAGATYTFSELGHKAGAGTLADPFLRLDDASGAVVASNDDIVAGSNPDSQIVFTPTTAGTYYVEAGAFADGYMGSYRLTMSQGGSVAASPPATPTAGNDVLSGGSGADTIDGLAGNDTITDIGGSNYLRGGAGDDSILGGSGFDDINGNAGADTIDGGSGGNDWLVGGQGNDLITAHAGHNILYGNLGADTLIAGSGGDLLRGGQGDDSIAGGAGNDWISGDRGNDTLSGGAGADTFHTASGAGIDRVLDFHLSEGDRVQLDPGTHYTVNQVGADTVIDMGGGDQMILVGVQSSTLTSGWIFGA